MITQETLDELTAFDSRGNPVLSVYLNLDTERTVQRSQRLIFDDLAARLAGALDELGRVGLDMEAQRVRELLGEGAPDGAKGLAIFSCTAPELWRVVDLPVPVEDMIQLDTAPHLLPLHDVLDEYERYAVALVDTNRARLFSIHLGRIEEQQSLASKVLSRQANGGWSQARYQRRHDLQVSQHVGAVVDELLELHEEYPFDRLILAGVDAATRELREALPPVLADTYAASFAADLSMSDANVLARTLEVARQDERRDEDEIVEAVLGAAKATGGNGVAGLKPTLEAVWKSQVHLLVVAEGTAAPGAVCPSCLWIVPIDERKLPDERAIGEPAVVEDKRGGTRTVRCQICRSELEAVPDVVERAVRDTMTRGGTVEIVHGAAAERLAAAGGIAASLRFGGG